MTSLFTFTPLLLTAYMEVTPRVGKGGRPAGRPYGATCRSPKAWRGPHTGLSAYAVELAAFKRLFLSK